MERLQSKIENRKSKMVLLFAACFLLAGMAFGQKAPVGSTMAEGRAVPPNLVHIIARHCQNYMSSQGHLWWKHIAVDKEACAADPTTVFYDHTNHNLRVNAGVNWQYGQMAGGTAAVCTYIALTNTAITPGASDTTLSGEISSNGLARALATPAHSSNATSYTLTYTWTCATNPQAAQAAGMFNNSSAGTECFENTFTQASLAVGDTLTVTWTVNF
jgi:leucyl aminopeptidase (aminopeptidase T)